MRVRRSILCALTCLTPLACESPSAPRTPTPAGVSLSQGDDGKLSISGGGVVDLSAIAGAGDATFSFNGKVDSDGTTKGHFRQSRLRNGLVVEFAGDITCITVDAARGRARIGGVITENNSTDPAFVTANHEVGDDVWFRVADGGEGGDAVDGSTTYGFKPTLVNTSAEYCALPFTGLPWWNPASIFPLSGGNIQVRP